MDASPIYLNQQINATSLQEIIYERWAVVEAMLDGATTVDEIVAATGWEREHVIETVLQFLSRSAVRRPDFDGAAHWNVYDGEQARFLQAFVEEHGLAEVELST